MKVRDIYYYYKMKKKIVYWIKNELNFFLYSIGDFNEKKMTNEEHMFFLFELAKLHLQKQVTGKNYCQIHFYCYKIWLTLNILTAKNMRIVRRELSVFTFFFFAMIADFFCIFYDQMVRWNYYMFAGISFSSLRIKKLKYRIYFIYDVLNREY